MNSKLKKLIILNLPYLILALLATKAGQTWRLTAGVDLSAKLLHITDGFLGAFQNPMPSFHPFDLCSGLLIAGTIRLAVYIKGKNAKKYRKNVEYGCATQIKAQRLNWNLFDENDGLSIHANVQTIFNHDQ